MRTCTEEEGAGLEYYNLSTLNFPHKIFFCLALFSLFLFQVPGFRDWYNINYKNDPAVYTYKLLDDYSVGDLVLVVE